ncbi:sugar-binding transcriptional regulator [Aureimonas sp. AU4]|uniref:sugar-binding transcriptional regulator n=1 Tax=Aureimonas sp. AU4 TaxID=1638163 RepID=UPI00078243DA|nr:sugar-binding transcriptional regulator [Aureimonas sp. AU4]
MAKVQAKRDSDDGLAVRAAWLHYAAGMTQAEVAQRLGLSSAKAHRLIAWAYQNGVVRVSVSGPVAECVTLEMAIAERFGLGNCEVVPDLHEEGLPLRALGLAGAEFLQREIEGLGTGVVGIGHGRTLAAAVASLPRLEAPEVRFVSLMGGLTRNYAANPHDVMYRLAEKTSAAAYVMPIPFFANTVGDRAVLLEQRGVGEVFDLAVRSDLMVVGIGTAQPDTQLVSTRMILPEEIADVRASGGVGEMLGHFFDAEGAPVETLLTARTISPEIAHLRGRRIVALAGGASKVEGVRSVLRSGLLTGLVTDERTARALVDTRAP